MAASTYRRIVIARRGGPDVLEIGEEPIPNPGPGQVRIKTLAAGVSAFDVMLRSVSFPGFPKPPFTPGVDMVGHNWLEEPLSFFFVASVITWYSPLGRLSKA